MKTEELLRYGRMYAELGRLLRTHWLDFGSPSSLRIGIDRLPASLEAGQPLPGAESPAAVRRYNRSRTAPL